jgi:SAM-dependent methyltransferase
MYDEFRYYRFGLKLGIANLLRNGFALGLRKTLGKIAQPINSYTRFPEYFFLEQAMHEHLCRPCRILDIGSPKLFGFYLATHYPIELHLTDLSPGDVREYELFWSSVRDAVGEVSFAVQDARHLSYGDDHFDMVYSMSVVEHIEGREGDSEAVREMMRVLKPGGHLLVSVPYGSYYVEQYRVGLRSAATKTADTQSHFFQRIYDSSRLRQRLATGSDRSSIVTVSRRHSGLTKRYSALGENARGLLGFLSPFVSRAVNRHCVGYPANEHHEYCEAYTSRDVYGDAIVSARKPLHGQTPSWA